MANGFEHTSLIRAMRMKVNVNITPGRIHKNYRDAPTPRIVADGHPISITGGHIDLETRAGISTAPFNLGQEYAASPTAWTSWSRPCATRSNTARA